MAFSGVVDGINLEGKLIIDEDEEELSWSAEKISSTYIYGSE